MSEQHLSGCLKFGDFCCCTGEWGGSVTTWPLVFCGYAGYQPVLCKYMMPARAVFTLLASLVSQEPLPTGHSFVFSELGRFLLPPDAPQIILLEVANVLAWGWPPMCWEAATAPRFVQDKWINTFGVNHHAGGKYFRVLMLYSTQWPVGALQVVPTADLILRVTGLLYSPLMRLPPWHLMQGYVHHCQS